MSDSNHQDSIKSNTDDSVGEPNLLQRWWVFWLNVLRRFESKGGFIHASSLSYTSLVGMIPVLAVGLSVATSLMVTDGEEGQKQVTEWIEKMIQTVAPMLDLEVLDESNAEQGGRRQEVARRIVDFIDEIHTTSIGVTSVCVFLVVAIMLLRSIERTFNQVWDISKNRTWSSGIAQYWAGLTLGPFLFVLGTSLSSSATLHRFSRYFETFGIVGTSFLFLLSWLFTGAACALIYKIMTNTRMTFKAASCGGLAAGFLLQLNSQLPVVYYSNVATNHKVFGSLAAVPILLLGLYVSWIILIFGSHVAYMVQFPNQGIDSDEPSPQDSKEHSSLTAVRVMQAIASRFQSGGDPYTSEELADHLQLEYSNVVDVVELLTESGLVFRGEESSGGLSLGKPAEGITLRDIFKVVEKDSDVEGTAESGDVCFEMHRKVIKDRDQSAVSIKLIELVD